MNSEGKIGQIGACIRIPFYNAKAAFSKDNTFTAFLEQLRQIKDYQRLAKATIRNVAESARISHNLAMGTPGFILMAIGITAIYAQSHGIHTTDPIAVLDSSIVSNINHLMPAGLGLASVSQPQITPWPKRDPFSIEAQNEEEFKNDLEWYRKNCGKKGR